MISCFLLTCAFVACGGSGIEGLNTETSTDSRGDGYKGNLTTFDVTSLVALSGTSSKRGMGSIQGIEGDLCTGLEPLPLALEVEGHFGQTLCFCKGWCSDWCPGYCFPRNGGALSDKASPSSISTIANSSTGLRTIILAMTCPSTIGWTMVVCSPKPLIYSTSVSAT